MRKELIVNVAPGETRVALLENGVLAEFFVERGDEENITGSIYKGRVQRVLPGMQAAFVDIGLKQASFLYVDDVMPDPCGLEVVDPEDEGMEGPLHAAGKSGRGTRHRIETLLKEGQEIMVQVIKAPVGTKGARVTTQVSLPGRFLVLMPTVPHVGVSRKILCDEERTRLKVLVETFRNPEHGYIFRTAAEGVDPEAVSREISVLDRLWEMVQDRYKNQKAPVRIHRDLSVTFRSLRDLLTHDDARRLVIDSREGCKAVSQFLARTMPDLEVDVVHYQGKSLIFDTYNIEAEIQRALRKKVWLKSGGYIIIEQTEALVAIDVNTGRYVGKENFEETILLTNLEAVREIAHQIRLRNLCGIIIIDFIDMARTVNQERVFQAFRDAVQADRVKTNILPMSELGLVQMTRKRTRKSLSRILCSNCPCCDGRGHLSSPGTLCFQIYRELMRYAGDAEGESFTVTCHPETADELLRGSRAIVDVVEKKTGMRVHVVADAVCHPEEFDIVENLKGKTHRTKGESG
ncbi:Rne/Rng family ribonuclease [Desulfobotulus sp. H1]|uniref:Ribonuclease G n=1 Tax=Desulfobotulus pelophilus TaxID=2823377 RepID=A0ABT3NBG8_9BACT|nr:Rne/Rng family ribonuclease [Desulfobotulus pelophilus]MCW7754806.1 Rne/Rng family ribonuclease [Desulfobotulus pelophilus]